MAIEPLMNASLSTSLAFINGASLPMSPLSSRSPSDRAMSPMSQAISKTVFWMSCSNSAQDSRSFCRESLKQELLDLLVLSYFFHVSTAHNNVGHLEDAEFFFDRAHDSGGQKHLRRADFDAPHHLLVAAELTGMEDLDFY